MSKRRFDPDAMSDEEVREVRRKFLLAAGIGTLAIILVWFGFTTVVPRIMRAVRGEVSYLGHPTSHWTQTLAGKNPSMTLQEAYAGLQQGGEKAVPVLAQVLKSEEVLSRHAAAKLLAHIRSKDAIPALTAAQKDSDQLVRCWSAFALLVTAPEEGRASIPIVLEAAGLSSEGIAEEIDKTLPKYPADKRVAGLIEALSHRDVDVRFRAVKHLAAMGPEATPAVPALIVLLSDRVTEDRGGHRLSEQAVEALTSIGPEARKQAAAHYLKQLQDPNADRVGASYALGRLRGDAFPAVELLKKLAKDKDVTLAETAQNALEAIPKALE